MKSALFPVIAFSISLISPASCQESEATAAVKAFLVALKSGDLDAAESIVLAPPGREAETRVGIEGVVLKAKGRIAMPEAVASKEAATVAAVIVKDAAKRHDGRFDYDTIYLLRRAGTWRMVMNIRAFMEQPAQLTAAEQVQLDEVRQWERAKKADLSTATKP